MKYTVSIWSRIIGNAYDTVNTCEKTKGKIRCSKSRRNAITLAVLGLIAMGTGLFIVLVEPYDRIFKWKTLFSEGGEMFELWRLPPANVYLRVFLWNVTNKESFMSGEDTKLKIQEVGPYVYRELLTHDNVTFNDNGTLSAIPRHPLIWVPELSEGRREDDILILPNIALLSIAHVVSDESYFTRMGLNILIRQLDEQPLVQMTAREFMFDYRNALMALGNQFMPNWIYFDKLGLIDRMYDFEGDFETIYTGETDISKVGLFDTYHGSTKVPQWENPCGNIQGASDGTKFPSFIKPEDKLLFFRKSMCRSKYLVHVNDTVVDGLDAYVYHFDSESNDNGKYNKSNSCFCEDQNNCLPPGLLDVHGCYYGFPIALSEPHFLNGDSSLSEKTEGSNPNPENHESYFIIQPTSGVPLKLAARFQINMVLKNIKTIANVERFSEMILPLLWAEFRMYSLPEFLLTRLSLYLKFFPIFEKVILYGSSVAGIVLILASIYICAQNKSKSEKKSSTWIENELHIMERKLSNCVYISNLLSPAEQSLISSDLENIRTNNR